MKLPEAFVDRIRNEHPQYAEQVLPGLQEPAVVSVRLNPAKIKNLQKAEISPVALEPVPWEPFAFYLSQRPVFTLDPLFHAGLYYVQDASSMLTGEVVRRLLTGRPESKPLKILDLCAAPGGKSTHLASVIRDDDLLICNEVIRSRVGVLRENITKWGYCNTVVTSNDPGDFGPLGSWFDIILVDAPCSGEGLFRKDEKAVLEWSAEAVEHCALRQKRILEDIWPVLKTGGYLLYSTCTFNKSENDDQIENLIATGEAEAVSFDFPAAWGVHGETTPSGGWIYRGFPGIIHGEGFTFSVLRKTTDNSETKTSFRRGSYFSETKPHSSAGWLNRDLKTIRGGTQTFLVPDESAQDIVQLSSALHIHQAGHETGDESRPAHAISMSNHLMENAFSMLEVDAETALQYLQRASFPVQKTLNGIQLITHRKLALGFGKATSGRINNHYPKEWRIKMTGNAFSIL